MPKKTEATILLETHLRELSVYTVAEYQFATSIERKFRFDFAVPTSKLGIEINGGIFGYAGKNGHVQRGAHSSVKDLKRDMDKMRHAALLGWRVVTFLPEEVMDGRAIAFIKRCL